MNAAVSFIGGLALSLSLLSVSPAWSNTSPLANARSSVSAANETDVAYSSDPGVIFGLTLIRLEAYLGAKNPIRNGRVTISDTDGVVLFTGKTNKQGQEVILAPSPLPDRLVVRVQGGKARGARGKIIDLRAFFEPKDGEVVEVNPLTTLDEVCRSENYGTYCAQAVDSYYNLSGSSDYEDLVGVTAEWFDGNRFGRNATRRKITTFQWAERVLLRAYAGKAGPRTRPKAKPLESANEAREANENSVNAAAAGAANAGFAAKFASAGKSFVGGIPGGAGAAVGAHYFTKLMVWAEVPGFEEPDIIGEINQLREDMRQHFAEVNAGINDLKIGQARLMSNVDRVYNAVINSDYQNAVRAFDERDRRTRLDTLLDSWQYLLQYANCTANGEAECRSLAGSGLPSNSILNDQVCNAEDLQRATTQRGREMVVLCAQFRRALGEYAQDFTVNGVRDRLLGGAANVRGIIPLGQYAYARNVLNSVVYPSQQPEMIAVGEYWLGVWAKDKGLWALITSDEVLVDRIRGSVPGVARDQAAALHARYDQVAADRSGQYFPTRMPQGCEWGRDLLRRGEWAFYDLETRAFYTRGAVHYFDRFHNRLAENQPRIPHRGTLSSCEWVEEGEDIPQTGWGRRLRSPWQAVPVTRVPSLGRVVQEVRAKWGVGNGRSIAAGRLAVGLWEGAGGCYVLNLGEHLRESRGRVIMCPYLDYATTPEPKLATGMACTSVSKDAFATGYNNLWWQPWPGREGKVGALNSSTANIRSIPWSGCAPENETVWNQHTDSSYLFPGKYMAGWDHNPCKFCIGQEDRGPYKDARQGGDWRKYSIGGGYVRDYLPLHGDVLPAGVSRAKMSSFVQHALIMRPEQSGEGFVPRP